MYFGAAGNILEAPPKKYFCPPKCAIEKFHWRTKGATGAKGGLRVIEKSLGKSTAQRT
jgi:hypothetical protein